MYEGGKGRKRNEEVVKKDKSLQLWRHVNPPLSEESTTLSDRFHSEMEREREREFIIRRA